MNIFTPKLIRKIFATIVVSGLVAGMTMTAYATGGVTLSSRGNISYNADGEGDPDVYFSSSDLENLNTSLSTVNSSVSALTSRVGAAEADVTTIKNALGGGSGTELTTVMQNLLAGLNTKTGQNASTLQAAVNGMADPGDNVKYPALTPTGRQETEYGVVGTLNGYYNNKNLKILQGSNYGINATHAYENMYEDGKTVSSETSAPYVTDSDETHAGVLTITPPAGYYDGEKSIYVDTKEIVDNGQDDPEIVRVAELSVPLVSNSTAIQNRTTGSSLSNYKYLIMSMSNSYDDKSILANYWNKDLVVISYDEFKKGNLIETTDSYSVGTSGTGMHWFKYINDTTIACGTSWQAHTVVVYGLK